MFMIKSDVTVKLTWSFFVSQFFKGWLKFFSGKNNLNFALFQSTVRRIWVGTKKLQQLQRLENLQVRFKKPVKHQAIIQYIKRDFFSLKKSSINRNISRVCWYTCKMKNFVSKILWLVVILALCLVYVCVTLNLENDRFLCVYWTIMKLRRNPLVRLAPQY